METVLSVDFWNLFYKKFDELVKNYNFTKDNNTCYQELITNNQYSIVISNYTHPQFDEVELSVEILCTNTNNKLYENKYVLINNYNRTKITLEKPMEHFINDFFDEIIEKLNGV